MKKILTVATYLQFLQKSVQNKRERIARLKPESLQAPGRRQLRHTDARTLASQLVRGEPLRRQCVL